jgi:beta-lactam-binding protein with PASTA domain
VLVLVLLLAIAAGAYALMSGGGDEGDISVPNVVGMKERAAVRAVEDAGLVAETEGPRPTPTSARWSSRTRRTVRW